MGAVISAIVPVLNGMPWLEDQLRALAAQECDIEWEVVIADNGSTDAGPLLVREWAERALPRPMDRRLVRAGRLGRPQRRSQGGPGGSAGVLRRRRRRAPGLVGQLCPSPRHLRRGGRSLRLLGVERSRGVAPGSRLHAAVLLPSCRPECQLGRPPRRVRGGGWVQPGVGHRGGHRSLLAPPDRGLPLRRRIRSRRLQAGLVPASSRSSGRAPPSVEGLPSSIVAIGAPGPGATWWEQPSRGSGWWPDCRSCSSRRPNATSGPEPRASGPAGWWDRCGNGSSSREPGGLGPPVGQWRRRLDQLGQLTSQSAPTYTGDMTITPSGREYESGPITSKDAAGRQARSGFPLPPAWPDMAGHSEYRPLASGR